MNLLIISIYNSDNYNLNNLNILKYFRDEISNVKFEENVIHIRKFEEINDKYKY